MRRWSGFEVVDTRRLFAVVNEGGWLMRGTAVDSWWLDTGVYEVEFDRDVGNCAFFATVAGTDQTIDLLGWAYAARRATNKNAVAVATRGWSGYKQFSPTPKATPHRHPRAHRCQVTDARE